MKPFDGRKGKRLPHRIISDLRFFSFYIGNETLLSGTEWGVDYDISIIFEPSPALGKIFEIYLRRYDSQGNIRTLETGASEQIGRYIQSLNEKGSSSSFPWHDAGSSDYHDVIIRFTRELGMRTLNTPPLQSFNEDYCQDLIDYGSGFERLISIFLNVLRIDGDWKVINEEWARYRSSQYIRYYQDRDYTITPPLKEWETELK